MYSTFLPMNAITDRLVWLHELYEEGLIDRDGLHRRDLIISRRARIIAMDLHLVDAISAIVWFYGN